MTETAPAPATTALDSADRERLAGALRDARSASTRRTYASQWRRWSAWAAARGHEALPADPAALAAWLARRAAEGAAPSTLDVARCAVRDAHLAAGLADPTDHEGLRRVLAGLRRQLAGRPRRQSAPLTAAALAAIIATSPDSPAGRRDVAIARVMRDGLLRRSEAAALTWADVSREEDGSGRLALARSKTDQEGAGATLYLAPATMAALDAIRPPAGNDPSARLFGVATGESVARRIAAMSARAGLDGVTGHGPRVGMAQDLAAAGVELPALMQAGRWSSPAMPARYTARQAAGRNAVAAWYRDRMRETP